MTLPPLSLAPARTPPLAVELLLLLMLPAPALPPGAAAARFFSNTSMCSNWACSISTSRSSWAFFARDQTFLRCRPIRASLRASIVAPRSGYSPAPSRPVLVLLLGCPAPPPPLHVF